MNPEDFASYIIDICADLEIVKDYEINIHENVVLKCRIDLERICRNI